MTGNDYNVALMIFFIPYVRPICFHGAHEVPADLASGALRSPL